MIRRYSRQIRLGSLKVGGDAPVSVQSMTKSLTSSYAQLREEVERLEDEGCEVIRIAVPDKNESLKNLNRIVQETTVPVVADVHFDYEIALRAIDTGVQGIRINPGNIRSRSKLRQIAEHARASNTVVRVGVNSGSLEPDLRNRDGGVTGRGLADSALRHCGEIESMGHRELKVSIKASDVETTIAANRFFSRESDIPLHIGVTEAGPKLSGTIKSSVGIGALLLEGIGDTIRVSLSAESVEEVRVGHRILGCLGLLPGMPEIVSCPTCGRKNFDVISVAERVEDEVYRLVQQGYCLNASKVAVMGCAVNGPGEARDADLGLAGDQRGAVLFRKGEVVRRVTLGEMEDAFLKELHGYICGEGNQEE